MGTCETDSTGLVKSKAMDAGGTGTLDRGEIEQYVRNHLVSGREDYAQSGQEAVGAAVDKLMMELDTNNDGLVSWRTFSEWNRRNSVEKFAQSSLSDPWDAL